MNLLRSATALFVFAAFPSANAQRYVYRWEPTISPAPTETAIPSPSPSDIPTVSLAPTITGKPTATASAPPTVTSKPTESPTESPAPSPSPSDVPSGLPSASPSNVPSRSPSSSPSFVPSDMPSLAPTHVPSALPSVTPTDHPTVTAQPSIAPTDFPTVSAKTHFAETTYILSDVPAKLPPRQLVTFTTVAKEVIQALVDEKVEDATIDILYVEVLDQVYTKANGERRQLKKGEKGILQISLKIAADISPGDFDGFPEVVDSIALSTEADLAIEEKLKLAKGFFDFKPSAVQSNGADGSGEDAAFSNGGAAAIAISCVAGVALLFYHGRKTNYRVLTKRRGYPNDRSEEAILAGSSDDHSAGAFGKNSYIPRDWNSTSPRSIGSEGDDDGSKVTTFSTDAVLSGKPISNTRSFRTMFGRIRSGSTAARNDAILKDLESDSDSHLSDGIQITHTTSDFVSRASCCTPQRTFCSDNTVMPSVMEEPSTSSHSRDTVETNNTLEEMTAIETILEMPSDEQTRFY